MSSEIGFESPLGPDELLFRRLHAREELGRLTEIRLEVLRDSAKSPVEPKSILGKTGCVVIQTATSTPRYLHGVVAEFERGDEVAGRYDVYRLVLRPWLWQLTLGADCRIFQDKTVVQILDAIFQEYGSASRVDKRVSGSYKPRPYTVQYRETDFEFVSRLMEEEGLYYYFRHERNQHTLVLCDGPGGHSDTPGRTLEWAVKAEGDRYRQDVITQWTRIHTLQPLKFSTTDFAAEAPSTNLSATASRTAPYPKPGDLEVFDYPGGHDDAAMGTNTGTKAGKGREIAELIVASWESRHDTATALTPYRPLAVGSTFSLKKHAHDDGDFLVTSSIQAAEYTGYEGISKDVTTYYNCRFDAVPKAVKFQPARIARRPFVQGPQTATVIGPKGDEIHTDKYGRVKVQFHWDRLGNEDPKNACWVRVSQPWAGKGFGFVNLPRVGDEVVVDFLEGNPDRPLITGRVYNGENMPPWELPAQATVSGIKTRSSKGGGAGTANELRFDDKKGSEYVWFQAEKDFHHWVKNDARVSVLGNRKQEVKKDDAVKIGGKLDGEVVKQVTLKIGEDAHASVGGDLSLKVTGDTGLSINGATALKIVGKTALATNNALEVDAAQGMKLSTTTNVHIKATTGVVIDGGLQLSIKAGAAFITLGPDGVSISGPIVKINSGGSAGSASAAAKANPAQPKEPPAPPEHKDPLQK